MSENEIKPVEDPREPVAEPEISVNQYGSTRDAAVVVDEADRTVLLTPDETIVFEKQPAIDIVPKTRPRSLYAGMWGRNEIATVALGIFAILVVAIIYVFLVIPSDRELAQHQSEADTLETEQTTANIRYGEQSSTTTKVNNVLASEENFEASYLPPEATGRNALYQRLNSLIDAYGLTNTSGPDYAQLATVDQQKPANGGDDDKGRDRFRSIFPGVYVSMTVEGTYQNLRRFIREMESGREFVIVSAVQLEPSENERSSQQSQPAAQPEIQQPQPQFNNRSQQQFGPNGPNPNYGPQGPVAVPRSDSQRGKTHGEVVSLHLEMAAYFRRPNFVPTAAQ
jgi:hypothetical protein